MVPILETERLILRPVSLDDAERYQSIFAVYDVIEFLDGNVIPWPYPENGVEEFLNHIMPKIESGETLFWVLIPKGTKEMIGVVHINPESESDHRGFWLGKEYWGKGYMSEAVAITQDYCFDILKMPKLLLSNAEPNVASHRIKEKAGAVFLGYSEPKYFAGGGTFRSAQWELRAEDWKLHKENF